MTANLETRSLAHRSLSPHSAVSETANERFPSFEDETWRASLAQITESPLEASAPIVPEYRWPVRSNSQRTNRGAGHKHRRSVSEALNNFRTRQGSVSENAHELAEALKAPISYKLIVSETGLCCETTDMSGPVYRLVHDFRSYQYLVQIYSQRIRQTRYFDHHPVRFGLDVVLRPGLSGIGFSFAETKDPTP